MRARSPYSGSNIAYSFGPGPWTPAIKYLIIANVVLFVAGSLTSELFDMFALRPRDVVESFALWQPVTYMFMHGGVFHVLFNMLSLWMFGTELERMWGSAFFVRYYIVTGVGAGLTQILLGFLPGRFGDYFYDVATVGASGAIFGVLLAYGLYFATREVMMYGLFPVQARYMVMIVGAISLYSAMGGGGGVAHTAHLGGLATGWIYLKGRRVRLAAEIQYQFARWRINRARRRFDVHQGGRGDKPRYH